MPSTVQHLTLDNGLQVTLRHAPQLKRCAAAIRVMAGSHDAPRAHPGLAHFLEHLLFLGNDRFPLDDGLMRYVQRHGGQVNASTRERTTDYFFEVPQAAFAGGLERLCEMLARPLFDLQRQSREREVIHAEFIAWSRNPQAQLQFALLQQVSRGHPLSAFHAGNRYSLPIHSHAFQTALRTYHQRFYQAGQMVLSLSGPQSLEQLQTMACAAARNFTPGERIEQAAVARLVDDKLTAQRSGQHLDLLHAIENQPAGMEQAIEFLATWLTDARPGGLLSALRRRGWGQALEFNALYSFAGQALLLTRLKLDGGATDEQLRGLFTDWLRFFRDVDRTSIKQEYVNLQCRRAHAASALELACRDSASRPYQALDDQAEQVLNSLLEALVHNTLPLALERWHLPAAEPLLAIHQPVDQRTRVTPTGLSISSLLPPTRQQGFVYVRWQVSAGIDERLWQVLDHALQPLRERAQRAGVTLQFDSCARFWQLRCAGSPDAVVAVMAETLQVLQHPDAFSWTARSAREVNKMPIRALLQQLPEQLIGGPDASLHAGDVRQSDLQRLWTHARWQAMATGLDQPAQQALNRVLQHVPGDPGLLYPASARTERVWKMLPPAASEQALLLFCPLSTDDEACARLLAQHIQGPFYQRLRVELQLGYAVFSAFRQIQGINGLVFGVQSPNASHEQIIEHIHGFLTPLPSTLHCDAEIRQALAEQMSEPAMGNAEVAEWAWQALLAGRSKASLHALQQQIHAVDEAMLRQCADDLVQAKRGWLCLANGPAALCGDWSKP
ncbi:pyrroloquinoline quinone biosynthesis protein PqqF [Pseudomonas sp. DG56-2]|uniref:pyrroloquinoline quinone biosynthesis protein PqqF n=1 Tax=Pseudomonas sp. DG56-2 TaxID=2320270 RepID=UPI0010A64E48|nr:pyrroloquinoline quinone biosynthesis protein PqqF [Pseudomonas sp. DG56-2]